MARILPQPEIADCCGLIGILRSVGPALAVNTGAGEAAYLPFSALREEMWRYRATVEFSGPVRRASAAGKGTRVQLRGERVGIDGGDIHESLVIDI